MEDQQFKGCVYETFTFIDCDQAEKFSKDSQLEWQQVAKGSVQLEFCKQKLASAYICSNRSLSTKLEVFSNKAAFIFQVIPSQYDAIFIIPGGERAHHVPVKQWWVPQATGMTNGRLPVTVSNNIQFHYTVDIILLCVFYSLITSVQRASHGWSQWINAHFGSISESLQQSTFADNQGENRTGHQKSLSIFYRVNIDFLWLFIFITLSEAFYLFNIDVNGWTPKILLIKVLSVFSYLKLPFYRESLRFPFK